MIKDRVTTANFFASDAAWMTEAELHEIVTMCISGEIDGHAIPYQVCTGLPSGGMLQLGQLEVQLHLERPIFAALKHFGTTTLATTDATTSIDPAAEYIRQLKTVSSLDDAQNLTAEILRAHLAKYLRRTADDIDLTQPLHEYGFDSLKAVKLRTWINKYMKANVSLFDVLNAKDIHGLVLKIAESSTLVPREARMLHNLRCYASETHELSQRLVLLP